MIKTTNLRLNLDKPDHRKAYDILKSSDMSYSNIYEDFALMKYQYICLVSHFVLVFY